MRANRGIDPAAARRFAQHDVVQPFAHAVQALEFKGGVARHLQHRGNRVGVVGGELRIDAVGIADQLAGIGDVTDIRAGLAGEQRKAGMPVHLGALHFAVPVGALDQAHHDAAVQPRGQIVQPVDGLARALAIGLHHHAEPVPAGQRRIGQHRLDHLQREDQPVLLLGVDVHAHVGGLGGLSKTQHHGHQVAHHAVFLRNLVARMQR